MKKKKYKVLLVIVLIFVLISIPIIIRGKRRYGNNWIDYSKNPSICYYDGNIYCEISESEYLSIKGNFELTDKYIVCGGSKANLLVYYFPSIINYRVGETRDSEGNVIALSISALDHKQQFYKLSECEEK